MTIRNRNLCLAVCLLLVALVTAAPRTEASSHREAPFITEQPKVDGTDFYMFRSYEPGREGFVTLVANYLPLQDPYGGPNYFSLDPDARYAIHVDNTGDGVEDLSFVFQVTSFLKGIALPVGDRTVPIPLVQAGVIDNFGAINVFENYQVSLVRGALSGGDPMNAPLLTNRNTGGTMFAKANDNYGRKSFPNYDRYARNFVMPIGIPGCDDGRVFVGQRKDPFVVNLGETFDLVNIADPIGPRDAESDDLADKNVTSLILEVPTDCLTGDSSVIGGWTTARLPRQRSLSNSPGFAQPAAQGGDFVQVSRLGMPLVNEVVIGLPDKDLFNAARPDGDAALATYVTHPTLPELLEILFGGAGVQAPDNFPRTDLVAAFATGVEGLNFLSDGAPHEMLRLNTAIAPTPSGQQDSLGVLGGDNAGFPNGRRPGDDVVDIELRVAMGVLCHAFPGVFCDPEDAPSGMLPFTDGAIVDATFFDDSFPYLRTPLAGSPN